MSARLLGLAFLVALGACAPEPLTVDRKEIFVEPFREAEYELARLGRLVPFPMRSAEQPRAFSMARAFAKGDDERLRRTRLLMSAGGSEKDDAPDPNKVERPPTSLILADRIDVRSTSACYLGHAAFVDRAGSGLLHHVSLLVVNRESRSVEIPLAGLALAGERDGKPLAPMPLVVVVTDRGVKVRETVHVPPGEQRLAHVFFRETQRVSPILEVRWSALVEGTPGAPPRPVDFRGELVRRYLCPDAPVSPIEDRVARGLDFPEAVGTRADWVDPGLTAVPGSGK